MLGASFGSVVGVGIVRGEGATSRAVAQPQTHTCTFKPLPLNKKEKIESNEVLESKEVKAGDSEKLDSESETLKSRDISAFTKPQYDNDLAPERRVESAQALDSERLDSIQEADK